MNKNNLAAGFGVLCMMVMLGFVPHHQPTLSASADDLAAPKFNSTNADAYIKLQLLNHK